MLVHRTKINQFTVATLNFLSFKTRVCLNNKTGYDGLVNCFIYGHEGEKIKEVPNIGKIKNNKSFLIDVENLLSENFLFTKNDYVLTFGIVPEQFNNIEYINIDKELLFKLIGPQDHFVEYYNENYSFGVLYNIPPINHKEIGMGSLLLQAPKIFCSQELNTRLMILNPSAQFEYKTFSRLKYKLKNVAGECFLKKEVIIKPNSCLILDIKKTLAEIKNYQDFIDENDFCQLQAVCENSTLIPLTIISDEKNNKHTIEHSMPPIAYDDLMVGERKKDVVKWHAENW